MPKASTRKEHIKWAISCDAPTPLAFYRFIKPIHHPRADEKYRNVLNLALNRAKNKEIKKKITAIRKKFDDGEYKQDWETWKQEKRAIKVHRSIQETNVNVHNKFNSLVESQSIIVGDKCEVGDDQDKGQSRINSDVVVNYERSRIDNDVAVASKKKSKVAEYFEDTRNRNIFILCEPFRKLSEADADGRFEMITRDTAVKTDIHIPDDIKAYLCDLLSGDIESTLSKVEKPLGSEKTWSNQTIYRIFDLFSMFFNELVSGVSFGEVVNEAHKDRIYNINADQKPSNAHRGDRNDAVICQDENATVLYEQSFGPTEFDETHYLGDMTKLARNGVDDINYQFLQYRKSSITTAKKLKSIGIHGYKYFISIYLTDLISCKTYRIYEIFKCKIPISYSDRWFLMDIVKIGVLLEALLVERKSMKEKMCKEHMINESDHNCVLNWISIPDNTPDKRKTKKQKN